MKKYLYTEYLAQAENGQSFQLYGLHKQMLDCVPCIDDNVGSLSALLAEETLKIFTDVCLPLRI